MKNYLNYNNGLFNRYSDFLFIRIYSIWLDINNDVITLSSENPEQDSAIETIMVEDTKEQLNIGFKASYLIDAIQACKSGVVSIGLIDNKKGATITTPADPETVLVVMPMRL